MKYLELTNKFLEKHFFLQKNSHKKDEMPAPMSCLPFCFKPFAVHFYDQLLDVLAVRVMCPFHGAVLAVVGETEVRL